MLLLTTEMEYLLLFVINYNNNNNHIIVNYPYYCKLVRESMSLSCYKCLIL